MDIIPIAGWLRKRGEKGPFKQFERRWFQYMGRWQINYACDPSLIEKQRKGYIFLDQIVGVNKSDVHVSAKNPGYGFEIQIKSGRIFYLIADSEGERSKWINFIQNYKDNGLMSGGSSRSRLNGLTSERLACPALPSVSRSESPTRDFESHESEESMSRRDVYRSYSSKGIESKYNMSSLSSSRPTSAFVRDGYIASEAGEPEGDGNHSTESWSIRENGVSLPSPYRRRRAPKEQELSQQLALVSGVEVSVEQDLYDTKRELAEQRRKTILSENLRTQLETELVTLQNHTQKIVKNLQEELENSKQAEPVMVGEILDLKRVLEERERDFLQREELLLLELRSVGFEDGDVAGSPSPSKEKEELGRVVKLIKENVDQLKKQLHERVSFKGESSPRKFFFIPPFFSRC
eukprot:TRINITY_DN8128_c0_g1_i11.p1 TRINITY_DN8128_c0_g1~~TRINITY_DN8128_c0_g1_i11.p1  ORF type:complete len:406 (+),score=72.76 TRINITY_DN8128_c0_g1_i11:71-1288(+)